MIKVIDWINSKIPFKVIIIGFTELRSITVIKVFYNLKRGNYLKR